MLYKIKRLFLFTGIFLIMFSSSSLPALASLSATNGAFGENFNNDFGLIIDLNYSGQTSPSSGLGDNVQVLKDLSNPSVNNVDKDTTNDQQFFFSHFKFDDVDNIYLALNKLEFNLSLNVLGKTVNVGHVNGSAPFQSLLQYYKYGSSDVVVANTFRGLIAYSTAEENGTITPTSHTYFGYSLVEQNFLSLLNKDLTDKGFPAIPAYNYEPIYNESTHTFGMIYHNYFTVWQNSTPSSPSALSGYSGLFDKVATGGNMVGASLFDYLKFTYQIVEDPTLSNATYKVVNVVANYDLGPMRWLITRDSASTYNAVKSVFPSISSSNSFNEPASQWTLAIRSSVKNIDVIGSVPELTFYTNDAVPLRLNVQALKDTGASGMGIAVATSTNAYVDGQSVGSTSPITDEQDSTVPLSYGSSTFYKTNFEGKSTYTRTFASGTTESNLPVYISVRSLSEMSDLIDTSSLLKVYFGLQSVQTYGITAYSLSELNSAKYGGLTISDMKLDAPHTLYVTLVQMPKWSGLQVTQDPTFSAVAAVASDKTASSSSTGIPGFEMVAFIVAIVPLYAFKKKSFKK